MNEEGAVVHVIDDDAGLRESIAFLLRTHDLEVLEYPSAEAYLDAADRRRPGCLLLDLRMPGMGGLGLLERLQREFELPPTVVLTAHGDVEAAVRAMKLGARDFLQKPYDSADLLKAVREGLAAHRHRTDIDQSYLTLADEIATLSDREREVVGLVIRGMTSRDIAAATGLQPKSVEIYRSRILKKLHVATSIDMVRRIVTMDPEGWMGLASVTGVNGEHI